MKTNAVKSIFEYWESFVKNATPLVKDWLDKEDEYLKKTIPKDAVVLDVGCGFGRNIKAIAGISKKIKGIDYNKELVENAKKRMKKFSNVEMKYGEATKLDFPDSTFDFTICLGNTFGNFAKNKLKVLQEMKRATKKDGKIIISVYSEKALNDRVETYRRAGIPIDRIEGTTVITKNGFLFEQFTKEEIKKIFEEARLKVKITNLNPISYICKTT